MRATGPDHERWEHSAGAYLLGALPDDERDAYLDHLAACPACRAEVDELAPAADALPMSVQPMTPPPALKARIMAEVEREAALLAAAGPQADRPPAPAKAPLHERLRWGLRLPRLAAGLAVLVLGVAVGVGASQLLGEDTRTITAQVDRAFAPNGRAELEMSSDEAKLVASGLPAPPTGRVYQLWLKRPGRAPEPTSTLFRPSSDGTATATVSGSLDGVDQLLMTDEPDGGSQKPTRTPALSVQLPS